MIPLLLSLSTSLIQEIAKSGRILEIAEPPSARIAVVRLVAPGAPPVLAFRMLDGRARHRFGDLDLVLDDAGH